MDALPIYLSFDPSDATTANDLKKYLTQAFEGANLLFWDQQAVADEQYRKQARDFIEQSALFIACFSANYQDTPNVRWELDLAILEQKRRRGLQIMVALAKGAVLPEILRGYPVAPGADQPIEGYSLSREIQLHHCVQRIWEVLVRFNREPAPVLPPRTEYTMTFEDVRERVLVWVEQCDLGPVFTLLKKLLHPEKTPDDLFQLEDAFGEWRQQARRTKLSFDLFSQTMSAIRLDLRHLVGLLEEAQLRHQWQDIFAQTYYALQPLETPSDTLGGIFLPASDILIPEKLNLSASTAGDGLGALSLQQQQEFRRNLLLAQDAVGIGQFDRAHAHCEHVRNHLDPQSAQLYELLLLTYLKKETPDRIAQDAVYGAGSKLNHIIVYAGRFAEYQRGGKCPSDSGWYNLKAAAETLSNAFHRLYATYQNDYILHTGRYGKEVPDNRAAIARCIQLAMEVYRTVHPYRGFLELVVNELCNGGKYDYIRQVEIIGDAFRFASHVDFGLESEIREVVGMLEAISPDDDDALMNRQLRENLLFNLKAKCRRLQIQLVEERRRFVAFTDVRDSVIELVQAALLGYKIFGDQGYSSEESFLRLAIEQLLPGLLLPTAIDATSRAAGDLRWFTLDEHGEVATHSDCEAYRFDALAIVEKITRDHAGHTGWLQVHPNIKQEVFLQFTADIDVDYEWVRHNLQWTDIRRLKDKEARRKVLLCLQGWKTAYLAYPETGAPFLQRM
ncbi:MAG: toll/interleukin-1 receptor domain-containing protein, partial [Saprospiraceae bacterium]|nr:toll/interleukin-1 receptor domain-containing protein [Saprospiraceae bacterium]